MPESATDTSGAIEESAVMPEVELALNRFDGAIEYLSALATNVLILRDQVKARDNTPSKYQVTTDVLHMSRECHPNIMELLEDYHIAMGAIHRKALGGSSSKSDSTSYTFGE